MRRAIRSVRSLTRVDEELLKVPSQSLLGKKLIELECGHHVLRTKLTTNTVNCLICGPRTGSRISVVTSTPINSIEVSLILECGHNVIRTKMHKSKTSVRRVYCEHCSAAGLAKGRSRTKMRDI